MTLNEAIHQRRSVREFTSQAVEQEKIDMLLQAAMQAPSAGNQQPWEFLLIKDKTKLCEVAEGHPHAKFLTQTPLGIVVLCNEQGLKYPEFWQQDLAAATQNILLQAVELGLGGVWIGFAPREEYVELSKKVFDLPPHVKVFSMIAIGYPLNPPRQSHRFEPQRVHCEKYCEVKA